VFIYLVIVVIEFYRNPFFPLKPKYVYQNWVSIHLIFLLLLSLVNKCPVFPLVELCFPIISFKVKCWPYRFLHVCIVSRDALCHLSHAWSVPLTQVYVSITHQLYSSLVLVEEMYHWDLSNIYAPIDINTFSLGAWSRGLVPWVPFSSLVELWHLAVDYHHWSLRKWLFSMFNLRTYICID